MDDYSYYDHRFFRFLKVFNRKIVGYGDFYPTTILGRLILLIVCIWGICCLALLVITISNLLTLNNLENKAMNLILRLSKRQNIRKIAAEIVTSIAKLSFVLRRAPSEDQKARELKNFVDGLRKKMDDFKNMRRFIL